MLVAASPFAVARPIAAETPAKSAPLGAKVPYAHTT